MYEFNPLTSLELLKHLRPATPPPADDAIAHHPERHFESTRPTTFGKFVRRMFQRITSKRRAA